MIAVLDTNVLVSGIFFAGAPLEILERWKRGEFAIAVSPAILDEYQRVVQGSRHSSLGGYRFSARSKSRRQSAPSAM